MKRLIACVLLSALISPAALAADEPSGPVLVGSRVRILAPSLMAGRFKGRVAAMDDSSYTVEVDERMPLKVERSAISQLELSLERKRQWRRGLIIGGLIGVAVGAVYPLDPQSACDRPYEVGQVLPFGGCSRADVIGFWAFAGAVDGAGIGALIKTDQWREIALERVRVSVAPRRGGAAVTVSIGF